MSDLILYLIMAAVGYFVGSRFRNKKEKLAWTGKIQTVAIILLVFTMGTRMGANDEVIKNLGPIGLYALIITAAVFVFSTTAVFAARKLVRIDRFGHLNGSDRVKSESTPADGDRGIDRMTIYIILSVCAGMASGFIFVRRLFNSFDAFNSMAGTAIQAGLCILLLFVGLDLGLDGTVAGNFRRVGLRVFVFPLANISGTLAACAVCYLFIPVSLKELLAIGAGLGWYSLAPGIIMDAGFVTASAISFMHNVMRELFAIILIPFIAKKIGYTETIALPGAASMDVCLPIVERATGGDIAVYSFVSGVVLSAAVPVIVPLIIG